MKALKVFDANGHVLAIGASVKTPSCAPNEPAGSVTAIDWNLGYRVTTAFPGHAVAVPWPTSPGVQKDTFVCRDLIRVDLEEGSGG